MAVKHLVWCRLRNENALYKVLCVVRIINDKTLKMDKLKTYGCLTLALISVFMIGTYADATLYGTREIEPHQWALTYFFGLMFFGAFLQEYRK